MKPAKTQPIDVNQIYRQIANKLYLMNLVRDPINLDDTITDLDNHLAQIILPRIQQLLDRSLFDVYQVLYDIDVPEDYIKEQIMSVKNTQMIPSLIAFAIIDRLKIRYQNHQFMSLE